MKFAVCSRYQRGAISLFPGAIRHKTVSLVRQMFGKSPQSNPVCSVRGDVWIFRLFERLQCYRQAHHVPIAASN